MDNKVMDANRQIKQNVMSGSRKVLRKQQNWDDLLLHVLVMGNDSLGYQGDRNTLFLQ